MIVVALSIWSGFWLVFLLRYAYVAWCASKDRLSQRQLEDLRCALSDWAESYRHDVSARGNRTEDDPPKSRDVGLFEACTKVGLMWIRPESRGAVRRVD